MQSQSEFVLYCDRSAILRGLPVNKGIDEVLERLEEFRVRIVDTASMSDAEIQDRYIRAAQPAVKKKYSVRQTFGSRSRSGWLFGRGVPALILRGRSGEAIDVFPHNDAG